MLFTGIYIFVRLVAGQLLSSDGRRVPAAVEKLRQIPKRHLEKCTLVIVISRWDFKYG